MRAKRGPSSLAPVTYFVAAMLSMLVLQPSPSSWALSLSPGGSLAGSELLGGGVQSTAIGFTAVVETATTLAGSDKPGAADGKGSASSFNLPTGIATDGTNLYIADTANHKIRQLAIATGVVTTLAGNGTQGATDGTGTSASFNSPTGIATDGTNLYVADKGNNKIRRVAIGTGAVTTLAGSGALGGTDGKGPVASFNSPSGITTDGMNLYVVTTGNHRIRQVVITTAVVTTLAGSGMQGQADGRGTGASFNSPSGITTDGANLYVADTGNNKIRRVAISTGDVTTLAGSGAPIPADGLGIGASFNSPSAITGDNSHLYVVDTQKNSIRKIEIASGKVTTLNPSGALDVAGITTDGNFLFVASKFAIQKFSPTVGGAWGGSASINLLGSCLLGAATASVCVEHFGSVSGNRVKTACDTVVKGAFAVEGCNKANVPGSCSILQTIALQPVVAKAYFYLSAGTPLSVYLAACAEKGGTWLGAPTISGVSPGTGAAGTKVTITGTRFSTVPAENVVAFNGTPAAVTTATATSLTVMVPQGASTGSVSVTTAGGMAISAKLFTVPPVPTITEVSVTDGPAGTKVIITGTNFSTILANDIVTFNGVAARVIEATATSLTVTVPQGATTGNVAVKTAGGVATSLVAFKVPPTVTGFSPNTGPVGAKVTITGTKFNTTAADNAVRFNGAIASVIAATATALTVTVPPGASTGTVSVATAGGTATSMGVFKFLPAPIVTGMSPDVGAAGTKVIITGTNFNTTPATNTVTFNGAAATVTAATATSLTVTVPQGATTGNVAVKTAGGVATSLVAFKVPPTVTGFSPSTGPVGATVTISGTKFSTNAVDNAVRFNGAIASVMAATATALTVTVPQGASTGTVSVTTAGGTATSTAEFKFRRLNIEVQQTLRRMIDLQWSSIVVAFARSGIQFVGNPIALFLRQVLHAGASRQVLP